MNSHPVPELVTDFDLKLQFKFQHLYRVKVRVFIVFS